MSHSIHRRCFLRVAATGGALVGLKQLVPSNMQSSVFAAGPSSENNLAPLPPDIEPLVRLLEETPRERLLEEVAKRVRQGLSYQQILTALLLAGVRNVQPRPSVGFKFHAVLVVNSVHLATLRAADADRWLPLFWALDYFKDSQARNQREDGWRMKPVAEQAVPSAHKARQVFVQAMDSWDEAAADVTVAGLARSAGADEVFELLYRYGARDFRSIGHKAILVANSQRVLGQIGWRYAEPVLRSLAYGLLMHEGGNPAQRDDPADRPGRRNQELAAKIPSEWQDGKPSREATVEMLAALREGATETACDKVIELTRRGAAPQSIWDAVFCGAGELLLRQPGIVALHAITTTNALHYAYRTSGDDRARRLLLLQNVAFLPMFREAMQGRGQMREGAIDRMEPAALRSKGREGVEEVFADVSRDRQAAVGKALAYLQSPEAAQDLLAEARRLILLKGDDPHDYKFSVAALEDYYHVSTGWRDRFLAASMVQLRGSGSPDNKLMERAKAALKG